MVIIHHPPPVCALQSNPIMNTLHWRCIGGRSHDPIHSFYPQTPEPALPCLVCMYVCVREKKKKKKVVIYIYTEE